MATSLGSGPHDPERQRFSGRPPDTWRRQLKKSGEGEDSAFFSPQQMDYIARRHTTASPQNQSDVEHPHWLSPLGRILPNGKTRGFVLSAKRSGGHAARQARLAEMWRCETISQKKMKNARDGAWSKPLESSTLSRRRWSMANLGEGRPKNCYLHQSSSAVEVRQTALLFPSDFDTAERPPGE
jgi:hypothetical protein